VSITTRRRGVAPSSLERCTDDPEGFLRDVWGVRATVRHGSSPAAFVDLLSLDDVDRFLTTTALRVPFFRLVKAGETIPESSYTRAGRAGSRDVTGIADPARVAALFEGGATIVLQGLHRWSEPVARFCRDLELELGHACQVNAYVTPPGAQGLALHEDAHDVFVLQAFGRKRWEIHAAPREPERPPLDVEITAGDTLYLPTSTPHAASTQDVLSGHLTVGVHVTTWRDVLRDAAERATEDPAFDEPVPAGWLRDPEATVVVFRTHVRHLALALGDVDPRSVVDARSQRFLSTRAQLARGSIVERAAPIDLDDHTVLFRRPGAVCELRRSGGSLVALLGDRRITMPAWLEPAMGRIASVETFRLGDLVDEIADAESRAVLGRRLIREGLLTARPDGESIVRVDDP
jgi:bifunctional lysine-specific demethylase and histidyl-hydroxylase NO66